MKTYTKDELSEIIKKHRLWLDEEDGGERADLSYANLCSADLRSANLRSADLRSADLRYADLSYANLRSADLRSANLRSADLRYANLRSADLRYADLCSADLRYADLSDPILWGATGNMSEIKSIAIDTYDIAYTATYLQIGCELHEIDEWWAFDDERIDRMDSGALEWWKKWKPFIQQAIEMSPATPTKREDKEEAA